MSDQLIAIAILWIFIFIYAIAASIDFGAGFWSLVYLRRDKTRAANIANRYLSPSWEVTNVFVVLIVVALVSFFPGATRTLGTVLLVPVSIVLLLLSIRSAFLVYSHAVENHRRELLIIVSGLTGFLIPAFLILVLPVTYGGYFEISEGVEDLRWGALLTSPSVYAYILFAIASTLFLSALLLADYAYVSKGWKAYAVYRRDAIWAGPVALLAGVLVLVTMQRDAPWLYDNLLAYKHWVLMSLVAFAVGYYGLWRKRPRLAVVGTVLQYLLAASGYGAAHLPYIVYPNVTIESSFTDENTFHALFASYIVGFAILAPGFWFFWRMFMKDKKYLKQK